MRRTFSKLLLIALLAALLGATGVPAKAYTADDGKIFIPIISQAGPLVEARAGTGVPLERDIPAADLPSMGVRWYYNWYKSSPTAASLAGLGIQFVPMSYAGEDPELPADYSGYLLVFNEPDVSGQANLTPSQAADRYLALAAGYPKARLVVGGVSAWLEWGGWYTCLDEQGHYIQSWTSCFLKEFERRGVPQLKPQYWHAHAYLNEGLAGYGYLTPERARATLEGLHAKTGGTYWVTEYAEVHGDTAVFCDFTGWMKAQTWIARYAPFASRVTGSEAWYPAATWGKQQKVSLIVPDSPAANPVLSVMGAAYAQCGK
jgi:hypothetical protein